MSIIAEGSRVPHKFDIAASRLRCLNYRKRILEVSQQVAALHIGGAFSALEMIDCIYHGLMNRDSNNGSSFDTFILSKGHAGIAQYVVLENLGILSRTDLDLYCKPNGILGCHPDFGVPGIEASTGSLAHGLGLSVGMAHADRLLKADRKIYLLMSDGELQEGSVWESMMMGANLGLKNLVAFLDHNGFQSSGRTRDNHPKFYPIREKVEAFGWECLEVNGHDTDAIYRAVLNRKGDSPFLLICNTVKGRGVSYMEDEPIWHFRSPNFEEYEQALKELEKKYNEK